jgi:ubiquinone/menaquinone biosynthesis C-methylase UbiE
MDSIPKNTNLRRRQRSETEFFDEKVTQEKGTEEEDTHVDKSQIWLDVLGIREELSGKDVLECACGTGRFTTALAERAGRVESFDISPESVKITKARVERDGLKNVQVQVAAMEELPYQDHSFDIVVGLFILHHLADLEQGIRQVSRVLRPGGKAVFYETSASNPILMFWRQHLAGRWGIPKLGTKDEHPLTSADLRTISSAFQGIAAISWPRFRFFGKLYFQLFRRFKIAKPLFLKMDELLERFFPFLRKHSYQVMVTLTK